MTAASATVRGLLLLAVWLLFSASYPRTADADETGPVYSSSRTTNDSSTSHDGQDDHRGRRRLAAGQVCESTTSLQGYSRYFRGMDSIHRRFGDKETCLPLHKSCGWPAAPKNGLPLFVLSVGLEGAGHHLWTEILDTPVVDCLWINGRHYQRDVGDGVPRTTVSKLESGLLEQFQLRTESGKPKCRTIYDAEDSFPTGAIRRPGRVFMRPDIVNLQRLDGKLVNVKYLIILRNVTDTALSALRRNFFTNIDTELRTVEHTLTYLEAALRSAACDRTFIAHYEHALADPAAYVAPLASFLELGPRECDALARRLSKKGRMPARKEHKLTQYAECKDAGLGEKPCYQHVSQLLDNFFLDRRFMWPTFASSGFDWQPPVLV